MNAPPSQLPLVAVGGVQHGDADDRGREAGEEHGKPDRLGIGATQELHLVHGEDDERDPSPTAPTGRPRRGHRTGGRCGPLGGEHVTPERVAVASRMSPTWIWSTINFEKPSLAPRNT